jgi:hypothetical protein
MLRWPRWLLVFQQGLGLPALLVFQEAPVVLDNNKNWNIYSLCTFFFLCDGVSLRKTHEVNDYKNYPIILPPNSGNIFY